MQAAELYVRTWGQATWSRRDQSANRHRATTVGGTRTTAALAASYQEFHTVPVLIKFQGQPVWLPAKARAQLRVLHHLCSYVTGHGLRTLGRGHQRAGPACDRAGVVQHGPRSLHGLFKGTERRPKMAITFTKDPSSRTEDTNHDSSVQCSDINISVEEIQANN